MSCSRFMNRGVISVLALVMRFSSTTRSRSGVERITILFLLCQWFLVTRLQLIRPSNFIKVLLRPRSNTVLEQIYISIRSAKSSSPLHIFSKIHFQHEDCISTPKSSQSSTINHINLTMPSKSVKEFIAATEDSTELRGFRRTGPVSDTEPPAFQTFGLWRNASVLDTIIVGCSRLEGRESSAHFPELLGHLVHGIGWLFHGVSLTRLEVIKVYNYLLDHPTIQGNVVNDWKEICLDFNNGCATKAKDRNLARGSCTFEQYTYVLERLLKSRVETSIGRGASGKYVECIRAKMKESATVRFALKGSGLLG